MDIPDIEDFGIPKVKKFEMCLFFLFFDSTLPVSKLCSQEFSIIPIIQCSYHLFSLKTWRKLVQSIDFERFVYFDRKKNHSQNDLLSHNGILGLFKRKKISICGWKYFNWNLQKPGCY